MYRPADGWHSKVESVTAVLSQPSYLFIAQDSLVFAYVRLSTSISSYSIIHVDPLDLKQLISVQGYE